MIVKEAAVAGGHKLLDVLALAISLDDAQGAVLDGLHVLGHALPAHILVVGEAVEVIAFGRLMANDADGIMFGATEDGDCGPNKATGAESSFDLIVRILVVNRIGGGTVRRKAIDIMSCLQNQYEYLTRVSATWAVWRPAGRRYSQRVEPKARAHRCLMGELSDLAQQANGASC